MSVFDDRREESHTGDLFWIILYFISGLVMFGILMTIYGETP